MNPQAETPDSRYILNCSMEQETAALERLCQVVRVRGFRITRMAVEINGGHLDIALTLEGSRSISMLQSQLEKLHTVSETAVENLHAVRPCTA